MVGVDLNGRLLRGPIRYHLTPSMEAEDLTFGIEPYFLHKGALMAMQPPERDKLGALAATTPASPLGRAAIDDEFARAAISIIRSNAVEPVRKLLLRDSLRQGQLVWEEGRVYFRGSRAYQRFDSGDRSARVAFKMPLAEFGDYAVRGDFSPEHIVDSASARGHLSGNGHLFLFGYVQEASSTETVLRLALVGRRMHTGTIRAFPFRDALYVNPAEIREFELMGEVSARDWEPTTMRGVPERVIKEAFAELVDEPDVPEDWPGERSDLLTARVHIDGESVRAAFLFKGPAAFHPMRIADLGRNGDQIDRLFRETADLMILQHVHVVRPEVRNMMDKYASDFRQLRRYSVIDGPTTWQILRAYGKV